MTASDRIAERALRYLIREQSRALRSIKVVEAWPHTDEPDPDILREDREERRRVEKEYSDED